ncbi:LysR family transcriptional regulator [Bordetella petrii]|nr:LysR family transcriptional regulator [Bordetella petrii]
MKNTYPDLRSLECFVAVAEELSFSKAANRLHLSQPPLTKRVQLLEEELGVTLLERNTRSVRLTRAGAVLLREARVLFDQSLAMQRAVRREEAAESGTLRVGFISTAFLGMLLSHLPKLSTHLKGVEYVWSELTSPQQVEALRERRIDLAFVHTPIEHRGLGERLVLREKFVAALSTHHPLATRTSIRLSELAGDLFVMFPRDIAPGYYDMVLSACSTAGFAPRIRHHARHFLSLLLLPASGSGVCIVPQSAANLSIPGLKLVPVREHTLRSELIMLWNLENQSLALRRALEATAARGFFRTRR